ncbi:MAG: bifunctional folylpolyglutamate synthase/dihydrofolate synthase [Lachnospiraceae bacterium]|nr:bifunctional folylpolyglutamate synthase/dihydrofolate synthase [Lachnospiraceae bacterium]
MTYNQAYEYIEECARYGSVPGLESITELCGRLNNPQDELKFIHIAGTNGKGSISAYISSVLNKAGLHVGRYISPTICTYLERFDIGGRSMSKADFARYIDKVKPVCEAMVKEGLPHPTTFEIETAIAFLYFKDKKCDIVVLECGMGGRLDATNIVRNTLLSVFAHIDMDHMQYLGDTLAKIATEKAGIIKPGAAVVTGPQESDVCEVIKKRAEEAQAKLYTATYSDVVCNLKGVSIVTDDEKPAKKWRTPLLGTHQAYNAAVALKALKVLCDTDNNLASKLSDDVIAAGFADVKWPGRLQIVSRKPLTFIDGAHNPDAALRLKESLDILIPDRPKILIMGMLKDKEIDTVADIMCKDAKMIFCVTPPENPRAMRSVDLALTVREYNGNVTSADSVEEAVEMAKLFASRDDMSVIIAFGSLSYMGRMIEIYGK